MRRVVVTGMGIVSCLGNDADTVSAALREGRSGITFQPQQAERGLRSHVAGLPQVDLDAAIDRKLKRFMGDAAAYAYVAMRDAIADAKRGDGCAVLTLKDGSSVPVSRTYAGELRERNWI